MKKYSVFVSENAQLDLNNLTDYISLELKSPISAFRYTNGIIAEMKKLGIHAESIPISSRKSILKYGYNARRVNYKNHTIIHLVYKNTVIIQRIISGAMIV